MYGMFISHKNAVIQALDLFECDICFEHFETTQDTCFSRNFRLHIEPCAPCMACEWILMTLQCFKENFVSVYRFYEINHTFCGISSGSAQVADVHFKECFGRFKWVNLNTNLQWAPRNHRLGARNHELMNFHHLMSSPCVIP